MESKSTKQRRFKWTTRIVMLLLILASLIVGGHQYWAHRERSELAARITSLEAQGHPMTVAAIQPKALAGQTNAYPNLRRAFENIQTETKAEKAYDHAGDNWFALPLTEPERRILGPLAEERRGALAPVEDASRATAMQLDFQYPPFLLGAIRSDLSKLRALGNSLKYMALTDFDRGDHRKAIHEIALIDVVSRGAGADSCIVGHLVAIGLRALQAETLQKFAPTLQIGSGEKQADPVEVRALLATLCDDKAYSDEAYRCFQGERVMLLDAMQCLTASGSTEANLPAGKKWSARGILLEPYFTANTIVVLDSMTAATERQKALDSWQYKTLCQQYATTPDREMAKWQNRFAAMLTPSTSRVADFRFRCQSERAIAAGAIACRWYQSEHDGEWPETLDALLPKYLASVPRDPYAPSKPIQYSHADGDPKVWGVGRNEVDDGGSDAPDPSADRHTSQDEHYGQLDFVLHLMPRERKLPDDLKALIAMRLSDPIAATPDLDALPIPGADIAFRGLWPQRDEVVGLDIHCADPSKLPIDMRLREDLLDALDHLEADIDFPHSQLTGPLLSGSIQTDDGRWIFNFYADHHLLFKLPDGDFALFKIVSPSETPQVEPPLMQ